MSVTISYDTDRYYFRSSTKWDNSRKNFEGHWIQYCYHRKVASRSWSKQNLPANQSWLWLLPGSEKKFAPYTIPCMTAFYLLGYSLFTRHVSMHLLLLSWHNLHSTQFGNELWCMYVSVRLMDVIISPIKFCIAYVPCPLFENSEILQQPADFLKLTSAYVNAATSFIKTKAGEYKRQIPWVFLLHMSTDHCYLILESYGIIFVSRYGWFSKECV